MAAFQGHPAEQSVLILLTNDDGIYAPGLAAMERELEKLGEVYVVAPATEQSGVGHSITYLNPLVVKELFVARQRRGWAVEGSPADSVKIGIHEFCPRMPDLVVSGINGGLNAGINVLYSGTVAAAIEGASRWVYFRRVQWPLLMPTTLFVMINAVINAVRMVDHIVVLTRGGPNNASTLLLFHLYTVGFSFWDTGYAAAITVVLLAVLASVALFQFFVLDRKVHYK